MPSAVYKWRTIRTNRRRRHVVTVDCSLRKRALTVVRTDAPTEAARQIRHRRGFPRRAPRAESSLLHAAAVAWQGRAIVIPGHSHAGKSTLTAALLRAGAGYLSDVIRGARRRRRRPSFARRSTMPRDARPSREIPAAATAEDLEEPLAIGW